MEKIKKITILGKNIETVFILLKWKITANSEKIQEVFKIYFKIQYTVAKIYYITLKDYKITSETNVEKLPQNAQKL